jgi:hypothetical protein
VRVGRVDDAVAREIEVGRDLEVDRVGVERAGPGGVVLAEPRLAHVVGQDVDAVGRRAVVGEDGTVERRLVLGGRLVDAGRVAAGVAGQLAGDGLAVPVGAVAVRGVVVTLPHGHILRGGRPPCRRGDPPTPPATPADAAFGAPADAASSPGAGGCGFGAGGGTRVA